MKLKGSKNPPSNENNKVFFIISVLSWLVLLVTSWLSIGMPNVYYYKNFWLTYSIKTSYDEITYYPLAMHISFHYIVFILTFTISTAGFLIYITYRDDNSILDGMLDKISKFHFIPLLCISALFIIGESKENANTAMFIFDFIFTIIGLVSLIIVKIKTHIESPWYANFIIKKGAYSCFIALLVYNIGFNFTYYGIFEIGNNEKTLINWKTGCGIAFPIFIGLLNLSLAVIFQDIILAFMNLMIFIGMIINFYAIDRDTRSEHNATGEGIIDIVMISLSGCSILFLFLIYKKSLYNDS